MSKIDGAKVLGHSQIDDDVLMNVFCLINNKM